MELNINSPAYFTNQYGVIDEIYTMCRGLSAFVKEKQYSELVNIVGITPIVAPKSLLDQGLFKEVRKCDLPYGFASVSLQMDYDTFVSADIEKKKKMILDNIIKSVKAIPKKAKIDTDAFCSDVKEYCEMNKPRKRRLKLGDIYEIPLPNGTNAYGRLYKEYTLAIYKARCNDVTELPETEEYQFFVGVYKDLLQDREWPVVANRKFASEEDAWPPPQCVIDAITKIGSLYYKGEIRPCSYEECKDLEIVAAWDRNHVVDRLMGDDKWEKLIGRPKNPEEKSL